MVDGETVRFFTNPKDAASLAGDFTAHEMTVLHSLSGLITSLFVLYALLALVRQGLGSSTISGGGAWPSHIWEFG